MSDPAPPEPPQPPPRREAAPDEPDRLGEEVGAAERRKLRAQREESRSIWFGLGMFGLVGWSVAVPTLIGVLVGVWLDARFPGRPSWTLTLMLAGVAVGCLNAWYWLSRQRREIGPDPGEDDDG